MKTTLNEFDEKHLIGKYIKCYEWIEPDFGQICYDNNEIEESNLVYKCITRFEKYKTKFNILYTLYFETKYRDLDLYVTDKIEIFDTNPLIK